jgi:hypothetical protein
MYDAFKHPVGEEPRFRLTALKRSKPSIRDILLAAVDTGSAFSIQEYKEKTKVDSIPGDTWYTK